MFLLGSPQQQSVEKHHASRSEVTSHSALVVDISLIETAGSRSDPNPPAPPPLASPVASPPAPSPEHEYE